MPQPPVYLVLQLVNDTWQHHMTAPLAAIAQCLNLYPEAIARIERELAIGDQCLLHKPGAVFIVTHQRSAL